MSEKTVADDLGELRELACRVFAAIGDVGPPAEANFGWTPEGIYWDTASVYARFWPEDKAAQLIADWRAELDGEAA
jgi:hypothetical protein